MANLGSQQIGFGGGAFDAPPLDGAEAASHVKPRVKVDVDDAPTLGIYGECKRCGKPDAALVSATGICAEPSRECRMVGKEVCQACGGSDKTAQYVDGGYCNGVGCREYRGLPMECPYCLAPYKAKPEPWPWSVGALKDSGECLDDVQCVVRRGQLTAARSALG